METKTWVKNGKIRVGKHYSTFLAATLSHVEVNCVRDLVGWFWHCCSVSGSGGLNLPIRKRPAGRMPSCTVGGKQKYPKTGSHLIFFSSLLSNVNEWWRRNQVGVAPVGLTGFFLPKSSCSKASLVTGGASSTPSSVSAMAATSWLLTIDTASATCRIIEIEGSLLLSRCTNTTQSLIGYQANSVRSQARFQRT